MARLVRLLLLALCFLLFYGLSFLFFAFIKERAPDLAAELQTEPFSKEVFKIFMGAIAAYLLKQFLDERREEKRDAADPQRTLDERAQQEKQLIGQLAISTAPAETRPLSDELLERARSLKSYARLLLSWKVSLIVTVWFALMHLVGGFGQIVLPPLINPVLPLDLRVVTNFMQSIILLGAAVLIPLLAYRGFLRHAKSLEIRHVFRIGFLGVLNAGLIWLLHMSPEMWAERVWWDTIPGTPFAVLPYLLVTRLLVFPTIGFLTCLAARHLPLEKADEPVISDSTKLRLDAGT